MDNEIQKQQKEKRNKGIWNLHYEHGITCRQIGKIYGITGGRTHQILKQMNKDLSWKKDWEQYKGRNKK